MKFLIGKHTNEKGRKSHYEFGAYKLNAHQN